MKGKIIGNLDLKTPCSICGCLHGKVTENNMHQQLNCAGCGHYIKMLSKKEKNEIKLIESEPTLAEINFKLDLIITHLNIKNT